MATVKLAKTAKEISRATVTNIRKFYLELAATYNKMLDHELLLCPKCGEWYGPNGYYLDRRYKTNCFPLCKKCILKMAEQREKDDDPPKETRESVKKVLRFMDRIYDEELYYNCVKNIQDDITEKRIGSPFAQYFSMIQSLKNYKGKTWEDSRFAGEDPDKESDEINENSRIIKAAKKRFGEDYSTSDLYFLESQYEDWVSRYECNTKAQEEIFERLCFKKWEINKATKKGLPTKDLDKTYQELLSTANITPRQTGMDTFADAQTMGTLLQKYEETRPLPDIDEELEDVDKIGLYIDSFYRGHASKMLGLKNRFTNIYEKVMSKYTVKPPEYEDDDNSEDLFNKIFGSVEDF